jgi:hypothetical protein
MTTDTSIHHKNLMPVTYVIGDVAGVAESPVYAILNMNRGLDSLDMCEIGESTAKLNILNVRLPFADARLWLDRLQTQPTNFTSSDPILARWQTAVRV